jgi:3-dehydroquinate synthase
VSGTREPVKTIKVAVGDHAYEVIVGSELLPMAGALLKERFGIRSCAVITDTNIARLHAEKLIDVLTRAGFRSTLLTVPAGEKSKSLDQVAQLCEQMSAAGLDRSSFVLALGGGVIGDLAGFVASIYLRGIPCVQIPTTLLAQADSAIGGKTGVNTIAGKNLIGSFHQPALVVADTDTLRTLPPRVWNEGFAEIIKHAIIRDAAMFGELQKKVGQASGVRIKQDASEKLALQKLVRRNIEIKAELVAKDDRDVTGERALLNFGHTVGHAIEQAAGYEKLLHGEAISLGMIAACEISVRKAGLPESQRTEIIAMLELYRLPTRLPANVPREQIRCALAFDKKFERGEVRFVVTPAIGSAHVATNITMEDISDAIEKL